jgi:hypothetical protein
VDLKLSQELRELLGGRKYIKEEELTRTVLLEWAKRQGAAVKEVNMISMAEKTMGGTELHLKLNGTANSVRELPQEENPRWTCGIRLAAVAVRICALRIYVSFSPAQ